MLVVLFAFLKHTDSFFLIHSTFAVNVFVTHKLTLRNVATYIEIFLTL